MYAIIDDTTKLSDQLAIGERGPDLIGVPASLVTTGATTDAATAPFYFVLLANKLPFGRIVSVVENTVGSFDIWLSGATGAVKATLAEADAEFTRADIEWYASPNTRTRMLAVSATTLTDALADSPVHAIPQKKEEIDAKTRSLIAAGFVYNARTFSLSQNAQRTFLGMYVNRANETYPIPIPTIDDSAVENLADTLAVEAFYAAMTAALRAALTGGVALKQQVQAATTEAEVAAIIDNR